MPHVSIPDRLPRVTYAVGGTPQSGFAVPFPFFAATDIKVWVNGAPATFSATPATSLEFSVLGVPADDAFSAGNITLGQAVSNATVLVARDIPIERLDDFPSGPTLNIPALNTVLDRLHAIAQQQEAAQGLALRVPENEPGLAALPGAAARANTLPAFNSAGQLVTTPIQPVAGTTEAAKWWGGTAGGTAAAHTLTVAPAPVAYQAGQRFEYLAPAASTGATTLNVNGLGAVPIRKADGTTALSAGDILAAGALVAVIYDAGAGGRFRLLNVAPTVDLSAYAALAGGAPFTAAQTIASAGTGALLTVRSTDAGAGTFGLRLDRASASPAAADILADIEMAGRDTLAATRAYAILRSVLRDPVSASIEAELQILVALAGAGTLALAIRNGLLVGGATGGFQGTGTINAAGYFVNGAQVRSGLVYRSPNQTPSAGGAFTLGHGLGALPDLVTGELECLTAEHGYAAGDVIAYSPYPDADNQAGGVGVAIRKTATQLLGRWGNASGFVNILNATTGGDIGATPANWAFRAVAIRFA